LGLKIIMAVVDIAAEYAPRVNDVFAGMDELWYLNNFVRTDPDGKFVLQFMLPEEHYQEFPHLLDRMKKAGLITDVYRTLEFSRRRLRPMSAESFGFKKGRWRFDWTRIPSAPRAELKPITHRQRFDSLDLSVLTYLMVNAAMPVGEIAKFSGMTTEAACEHALHVAENHLIEGYGIRWPKDQLNEELGVPFTPVHKYVLNNIAVHGVTGEEQRQLSEKLNSIPFLWGEYTGRDYYAEITLPPDQMVEGMSYLREALAPVSSRSTWFMLDPAYGFSFTPPRKVFDAAAGEWTFDLDAQMAHLEEQLKVVREEARLAKQAARYSS